MRSFTIRTENILFQVGLQSVLFIIISGCHAGPSANVPTAWQKLGIPQAYSRVMDNRLNRRGNHPNMERKPPVHRIADPKNLDPESIYGQNDAIMGAAKIKQQEDMAPQKIKALKYLATIGCGCYDKDGKVEKAILAGLDDCTEEVRCAAIEALSEMAATCWDAEQGPCGPCCPHCCTEKIQKRLAEMAYEEKNGCPIEPSPEVRQAACQMLCICPPPIVEKEPKPETPSEVAPEARGEEEEEEAPEGLPATKDEKTILNQSAWTPNLLNQKNPSGLSAIDRTSQSTWQFYDQFKNEFGSDGFVYASDLNRVTKSPKLPKAPTAPAIQKQMPIQTASTTTARHGLEQSVSLSPRVQIQTAQVGQVVDGVVEIIEEQSKTVVIALKRQMLIPENALVECSMLNGSSDGRSVRIHNVIRSKPGIAVVDVRTLPNGRSLQPGDQLTVRILANKSS